MVTSCWLVGKPLWLHCIYERFVSLEHGQCPVNLCERIVLATVSCPDLEEEEPEPRGKAASSAVLYKQTGVLSGRRWGLQEGWKTVKHRPANTPKLFSLLTSILTAQFTVGWQGCVGEIARVQVSQNCLSSKRRAGLTLRTWPELNPAQSKPSPAVICHFYYSGLRSGCITF